MTVLTNANQAIVLAYQIGYRYTDEGEIVGPTGRVVRGSFSERSGCTYRTFAVRMPVSIAGSERKTAHPDVHRFIAYDLFGEVVFERGKVTYHRNQNTLDNRPTNLAVGTPHDVVMSRPAEQRVAHAQKAANALKQLADADAAEIRELKSLGVRTKFLARRFGCSPSKVADIAAGRIYRHAVGG